MSDADLSKLSMHEELREFVYHIKGILEVNENLLSLIETLSSAFDTDLEKAAETLSLIEIEIMEHLGYHRKAIKRPLATLLRKAYAGLTSHRPINKKSGKRNES